MPAWPNAIRTGDTFRKFNTALKGKTHLQHSKSERILARLGQFPSYSLIAHLPL